MSFPYETVGLVEAAYHMNLAEEGWLAETARCLHPLLPPHVGSVALLIAPQSNGELRQLHCRQASGAGLYFSADSPDWVPIPNGDLGQALFHATTCSTLSDLGPPIYEAWLSRLGQNGPKDLLILSANEAAPYGINIIVALKKKMQTPERLERLWDKTCPHLVAAARLRRALQRLQGIQGPSSSEYAGRLALDLLCRQARSAVANAVTSDQQRLLDTRRVWKHLTDGRYSLVDHIDVDGQHFIVMGRNRPGLRDPRALTEREIEVLRYSADGGPDRCIASRLGVSNSTVATHRTRAMEKLGVRSRALLAQLVNQLGVAMHCGSEPPRISQPPTASATRVFIDGDELVIVSFRSLRSSLPGQLTHAERRVATLLLEGLSNIEIARLRGTSVRTVANQAGSIFKKLGVRRRAQLADGLSDFPLSASA